MSRAEASATVLLSGLLSRMMRFLFVHIWSYRKKIILKNLADCFPEYSNKQLAQLSKAYYRHIADLVAESWLISKLSEERFQALVEYRNLDVLRNLVLKGEDIVLIASHYGNWEYLFHLPKITKCNVLAAYSPISNPYFEKKMKTTRSRFGVKLVPRSEWYRTCLAWNDNAPTIFITIADQRPAKAGKQVVDFFGKPTFIQAGAARIAAKRNCAVVYADIKKNAGHRYAFDFLLITQNACTTGEMQVMDLYYKALENTIRRNPAYWLWSHNRWKTLPNHEMLAKSVV